MVRIRRGPLKGARFSVASGINFLKGAYERDKTEALMRTAAPGDVCYDVGAHIGYFSLVMSKIVGAAGQVYAFEARPRNAVFLRRHLAANDAANVAVVQAAVSRAGGTARFETRSGSGTGRLSDAGNIGVDTLALDEIVDGKAYRFPDFIKIDIEGGETDALLGARRTIERCRPKMLVATHDDEKTAFAKSFLEELDYRCEVINPDAVKGDLEILALPSKA